MHLHTTREDISFSQLWCARRQAYHHWAIAPEAAADAGVDILSVQKSQQWETPAQVWESVTARWAGEGPRAALRLCGAGGKEPGGTPAEPRRGGSAVLPRNRGPAGVGSMPLWSAGGHTVVG